MRPTGQGRDGVVGDGGVQMQWISRIQTLPQPPNLLLLLLTLHLQIPNKQINRQRNLLFRILVNTPQTLNLPLSSAPKPTQTEGSRYQESLDFEVFETDDGLVGWVRGEGGGVLMWRGVLGAGVLRVHCDGGGSV